VITPRTTRLLRAADLRAFHRAILSCIPDDPIAARGCAVIVPTRTAGEELRQTIENLALTPGPSAPGGVRVLPDVVTRDDFYAQLRERIDAAPPALAAFHREVLMRRAAHAARVAGVEPPFNLRPGLIGEILALYDELRRRHKSVADFERLMIGALAPSAEHDRGAARLLAQTRFLTSAFERFEAALAGVDGVDEHGIRALALVSPRPLYRRIVVTVADQPADRHGLWTTDFDLFARLPGLEAIDVVATDAVLEAGFHQRLHENALPGIEDVRLEDTPSPAPILVVPDVEPGADIPRAFVLRDREEELADFARTLKTTGPDRLLGRTAIVFQRPLPYLYLARQVFGDAGIPYQALDSLPLAAEPFAAAVDLIFSAIAAEFTRGAMIELLRSPHFTFLAEGQPLTLQDLHALDRLLVEQKYLGGVERLEALAQKGSASLRTAAEVARELAAAVAPDGAPDQIDGILAFIAAHERLPNDSDPWKARHLRARAAVLGALHMLREAHAAHDPSRLTMAELSGAVRRWIEAQTFSPRLGTSGVRLFDSRAAIYADVDEIRIVGLTEADWPERTPRSIFYPQSLLGQLGWPGEQDRFAAARAQFHDLLRLPRRRVSLSAFTLEDDAIVSPSPLLEEVDGAGLPIERLVSPAGPPARVFLHEALSMDPVDTAYLGAVPAEWLALRASRTFTDTRFRGTIGPREPAVYAVSRMERYLECPFKYFAANVLKLPEEKDEQAWLTPQERGQLVHEVFEAFFGEWQARGSGAITTDNLAQAMALFDEVAERHLAALPEGDRALERNFLLGSAAAAGFGERAFTFEIEDGVPVVERLLEYELEGEFAFAVAGETRRIRLRSKADRIDLLEDGSLRIVDYKIGRAPDRKRSLQLPIYGVCAQQALGGRHGRTWTVSRAGYIAFKEKAAFTPLQSLEKALTDGQSRMLAVVDGIERGEFPVQPDEPFMCNWCAYASVCRQDYVGDDGTDV